MDRFNIALKIKMKHGRLQSFIDDMGWTQKDFAERIGVSPSEIGEIFNMKKIPRLGLLIKICELLNDIPENIFPEFLRDSDFGDRKDEGFSCTKCH